MKISATSKMTSCDALVICTKIVTKDDKKFLSANKISIKPYQSQKDLDFFAKHDKKMDLVILGDDIKNSEDMRNLGAKIAQIAAKRSYKKITVVGEKKDQQALIEGLVLGAYSFDRYMKKKSQVVTAISLVTTQVKKLNSMIKESLKLAQSVSYVRDLVNSPSNDVFPAVLGEEAKKIAKKSKKMSAKVFGKKQLEKMGMGALLAVGQASENEPKLVVMEYQGGKKNDPYVALVGKGITFDTGGMHLKIGRGINNMKFDMAGSATVLGTFEMLSKMDLPLNVVGIVATAENMIAGDALKPDDIIHSYSGQTIEVTNTDAEGRLVLADALYYTAEKYKPAFMIDYATLTGACITALGHERSGVLGNDQKTVDRVLKAGEATDEKVWQLPLDDALREKVKGYVSDLKNHTPEAKAGTIMGACFLSYFVKDTPWAHIDMGGSAWSNSNNGYIRKGATGRNLRLTWKLLKNYSS